MTAPLVTPRVTVGRIVHYRLNASDVESIRQIRDALTTPGETGVPSGWVNHYKEGEQVAAMVVRTFDPTSTTANLSIPLDGARRDGAALALVVTSRQQGDVPSTWDWPARA